MHHEAPRPSPATPGPSRPPGGCCCAPCSPAGQRAPRGARRRRGRLPRSGSKPPGRPATSRAGSPSGTSRAPSRRPSRRRPSAAAFAVRRDRAHLPAAADAPAGRARFGADVQVFAATEPRARVLVLALLGREARGGLGGRGPAGSGPDGRPRPPLARPAGLSRAGGVAAPRGLRAADGGRHALLDPRRRSGPRASPSWAARRVRFTPAPARRARAAPPVLAAQPALDREVGWAFVRLHPADFHRALEASACSSRSPTRARAAPRRSACCRDALPAQLHRRRAAARARRGG